jgi:hypothetical protein
MIGKSSSSRTVPAAPVPAKKTGVLLVNGATIIGRGPARGSGFVISYTPGKSSGYGHRA